MKEYDVTITETLEKNVKVEAASRDNVLYLMVLNHVSNRNGIYIQSMTVPVFLMKMKEYGLPGFETVRRSRQKVQADNPELEGTESTRRKRAKQEAVYREFATSEV